MCSAGGSACAGGGGADAGGGAAAIRGDCARVDCGHSEPSTATATATASIVARTHASDDRARRGRQRPRQRRGGGGRFDTSAMPTHRSPSPPPSPPPTRTHTHPPAAHPRAPTRIQCFHARAPTKLCSLWWTNRSNASLASDPRDNRDHSRSYSTRFPSQVVCKGSVFSRTQVTLRGLAPVVRRPTGHRGPPAMALPLHRGTAVFVHDWTQWKSNNTVAF